MVDYKAIAKDIIFVYILAFLGLPLSFLIRMLYAREMSLVDYGIFYGLIAFFGLFNYLRDFGLTSTSRYFGAKFVVHKDKSGFKSLFFLIQGIQLLLSAVIVVILLLFKNFIVNVYYSNQGHVDYMFNIFIIYWIFQTVKISNLSFFNIFQEQRISKFFEVFEILLILVFSFLGFFFFEEYKVAIISYATSMAIITCISLTLFYLKHSDYFHASIKIDRAMMHDTFKYAILILPATFAAFILSQMDILMIQYFKGAEEVAFYSSAFSITNLLSVFLGPSLLILYPMVAKLWHLGEKSELSRITSFFLNNMLIFILPLSFFFFAFSDGLIITAFTSKFLPATILLKLFCFTYIAKMTGGIFLNYLGYFGRPKESSKILAITASLNFILNMLFIPYLGSMGAVIATSICYFLMLFLATISITKDISIKINIADNFKVILACLVFVGTCLMLKGRLNIIIFSLPKVDFLFNFSLIFGIGLISYIIMLFGLGIITKGKIMFIKNTFFK